MALDNQPESAPGRLERLSGQLYRRGGRPPKVRRSVLPDNPIPATGGDWATPSDPPAPVAVTTHPMLKKIFWLVLIIFLFSALIAGLVFWRGSNVISVANVELDIEGPISLRAGEAAKLALSISNRNKTDLELVDLIIEYPAGAYDPAKPELELGRVRESLGTIKSGQTVKRDLNAVLFGEHNSKLPITFSLEYRLADSNAIFDKSTTYEVMITGSPLLLKLTGPSEVNSRQELRLDIEALVNSEAPLGGTLLTIDYPAGFTFTKASPAPTAANNVWRLPVLKGGEKWPLQIFGTLEGQDDEEKTFRLRAGLPSAGNALQVGALYGSAVQAIVIRRPQVSLTATLNGDPAADYVASSRQNLRLELGWTNNLATEIIDGEILVNFAGSALDPTSVSVGRGFYQSNTNTALWNKNTESVLARIAPGQSGKVVLTFSSVSLAAEQYARLANPVIDLRLKFRGKRAVTGDNAQNLETEISRQVKFNTVLQLAAKVLRSSGSHVNSGPLPPKVGQETSYSVVWTVVNSANDLRDGLVTAVLPPYMRWLGNGLPSNENLTFVEDASGGGAITWRLGDIKAGTGYQLASREVAFQVALTPSINQVGVSPLLLSRPQLQAFDTFTRQTLKLDFNRDLDTNLTNDPQFQNGQDKVVP